MEDSSHYEFFNLKEEAFAPTADPEYFFFTTNYEECMYRVRKTIDARHGIAIVFGNYGTGKTTLVRKLVADLALEKDVYNLAIVSSPDPTWSNFDLLESIINAFGINPSRRSTIAYTNDFTGFIFENRNRLNTLIIDDAQNLVSKGHIELLRLIQNLETPQHKLLSLVLFAQLEWLPLIRSKPSFEQRVNTAFVLNPLSLEQTKGLINFRLRKAGLPSGQEIFDEESIKTIYTHSEGIPRIIVLLCRNSLIIAERIKKKKITKEIILYTIKNTTIKGIET